MHLIKDEAGNLVSHGHGDEHSHEHVHADGSVHTHVHSHEAGHEHEHSHGCDGCHSHGECDGNSCKNETVAVLTYMLSHNQHHAAELEQMAANLRKLGMDDAARTIEDGVSDFQKGNLRLSLALALVKEHLKEA